MILRILFSSAKMIQICLPNSTYMTKSPSLDEQTKSNYVNSTSSSSGRFLPESVKHTYLFYNLTRSINLPENPLEKIFTTYADDETFPRILSFRTPRTKEKKFPLNAVFKKHCYNTLSF